MRYLSFLMIAFLLSVNATAQIRLPALVRDSMVLQRDVPVKIWGWASKGEKIRIHFNDKNYKTVAATDGKWTVLLSPTKAGGPYTMEINGSNTITLKDILVGDVWICSGQSNMVLPMERVKEKYPEEIANAKYNEIRQFFIPTTTDLMHPLDDLPLSYWKSAVSKDVLQFSATAYFFAKTIYEKYKVPIGLINASVGGTPIQAWISEDGLNKFPDIINTVKKNKDTATVNNINRKAAAINLANSPKRDDDKGLSENIKWYDLSYELKGWNKIMIPGYWEDQGIKDLDGVVWYRKEIELPSGMPDVPAKLFMGRIIDADEIYINGKLVGNITYQYPPRRYEISSGILKPGKNIITVRVSNFSGKGGFVPGKPYYIATAKDTVDLKGEWLYKVGQVFPPVQYVETISLQYQPTALYNAMLAPVKNYTTKGFLWYQGEANANEPSLYNRLLPALINDWRKQCGNASLPFLYVQLPDFMEVNYLPSESRWAELRNAQLTTLSVPNTGMAVTIGLGEWNDIHPLNKKDVGYRLALAAEKVAYSENIVYSGPLYQSASVDGNKVIINFTNTGSGLKTNDGDELKQLAIAGTDKKFTWANAKIEGDKIIVWSDKVAEPVYVRYAWADNPAGANLCNKEGLPASPFEAQAK
ncbi:MAG: sialate O-acetylesterase [Chitinophagaceae bacterium]